MEDARQGRGQEPVRRPAEVEHRPDEEELREGPSVEAHDDLRRDPLRSCRRLASGARFGDEAQRAGRIVDHPAGECQPRFGIGRPGEAQRRQSGPCLGRRSRIDLGRRQEVGEGVEVVADPDPSLGARLEGRRTPPGERIEDHVASARVARDEGVGERSREAREVRAHRVERMAPQPLLVLPLGGDRKDGQIRGEVEGELTIANSWRGHRAGAILIMARRSSIGRRARSIAREEWLETGR